MIKNNVCLSCPLLFEAGRAWLTGGKAILMRLIEEGGMQGSIKKSYQNWNNKNTSSWESAILGTCMGIWPLYCRHHLSP